MAMTPFHYIPKQKFLLRMIRPAIFAMFFGYVVMGFISVEKAVSLPPLQMAHYQYTKLAYDVTHIPSYCRTGDFANEYRKSQCNEFWNSMMLRVFWVALPFLFAAFFVRLMLTNLVSTYRRAEKKLQAGTGVFVGVVTDPPEMPNDLFGWFHYLRSITVELPNKHQIRVYIPHEAEIPSPGSKEAIVALGGSKGSERYAGAPFTPHVAVLSGDRK